MNKKAIIAMSGGVDSSVAALIMQEKNYEIIGATLRLYDNKDIGLSNNNTCCSLSDVEDARRVAYKLGIPYYVFNFIDAIYVLFVDDRLYFSPIITLLSLLVGLLP